MKDQDFNRELVAGLVETKKARGILLSTSLAFATRWGATCRTGASTTSPAATTPWASGALLSFSRTGRQPADDEPVRAARIS
jgi:hypothetical protein